LTSDDSPLQKKRVRPPQQSNSSLCLSCGLCCDGTLFGTTPVAPHDDFPALEAARIAVSIDGGERRFEQPCPAHDGRACGIYANRPAACRTYQCDLLRRVEEGAIDSSEALAVIGEAVRLKRSLVQAVRDFESGDATRNSRAKLMKQLSERLEQCSEPETRRRLGSIVVLLLGFDGFLRRKFGASVLKWSEPAVGPKS
jgi:Fe-S-cluster containining protein